MNKISFKYRFLFMFSFLLIQNFSLYSVLREELRKEVIVFIRPGYLIFPEQENNPLPLNNVVVNSPELSDAFSIYGVQTIQKAFPDFGDDDTIRISAEGYQFLIPQFSRIFRLFLATEQNVDGLINQLNTLSEQIGFAEKNSEPELLSNVIIPDDPYFSKQWHLKNNGLYGGIPNADIKATTAWMIFTGSPNVNVGIYDVGVLLSHPDLYPRVTGDNPTIYGDECYYSHGTHVAGLVAANTNNQIGVSGVDWNCKLISKQLFDQYGYLGDVNAANKILAEVRPNGQGVHIFNHSWGVPNNGNYPVLLKLAFVQAYKENRLSIAAVGNDAVLTNPPLIHFPANFQEFVVAVGSTDYRDNRSPFSNYGARIKVVAPGGFSNPKDPNLDCGNYTANQDVYSTYVSPASYFYSFGTSMAAPLVSGLAALIKGKNMSLNNEDIKNIICFSADDKGDPGWDQFYGYGRINSRRALEWTSSPYTFTHSITSGMFKTVTTEAASSFIPYGISGLTDGRTYYATRLRVDARVPVPSIYHRAWGYSNIPNEGYNGSYNQQFGVGYTKASYSYNWVNLQSYVYDVWSYPPIYHYGMYPCAGNNVQFAYTLHGINWYHPDPKTSEDRQQVGGCPWLFVHNITDSSWYIGDNNLLKRSEIPENSGQDLTDLYKIEVQPSLTSENQFSFKIIETENDYGYIDKVSFKAIDHPEGTKIGITESNQIVTYNVSNISSSNDAELNEEDNITRYIRYNYHGNTDVTGFASDSINAANFDLGLPPTGDSLALIFEVSNNQLAAIDEQVKDFAGEISMYSNSSPLPLTKKFTRRENSSVIIIPISTSDAIVDSVIITWFRDYNLKYLFVAPVSFTGYTVSEIPLVSAIHTVEGEVAPKLATIDGIYANIDSISMITLAFSSISAPQSGMLRDYVFETTGRYEETSNSEGGDSPMLLRNNNIPYENKLFNNYPNPFNPKTKIKFSIRSNRWVKISIYDLLGRQVAELVNQFKEKGEYDLEFNGSNLASGIYFYRIEAGDFVESKKMVLVK